MPSGQKQPCEPSPLPQPHPSRRFGQSEPGPSSSPRPSFRSSPHMPCKACKAGMLWPMGLCPGLIPHGTLQCQTSSITLPQGFGDCIGAAQFSLPQILQGSSLPQRLSKTSSQAPAWSDLRRRFDEKTPNRCCEEALKRLSRQFHAGEYYITIFHT